MLCDEWSLKLPKHNFIFATYLHEMRVVKEINDGPCKVSIFSWNERYLIKFEYGPLEQTYKVNEFDVLENELDELVNDKFYDHVMSVFRTMGEGLRELLD